MAVIADFAAYPEWADGVRAAEIVEQVDDGRASRVRSTVDALIGGLGFGCARSVYPA